MIPRIDPKVDYVFKKVFGSPANVALLINLLNAVLKLPPGKRIVSLELMNPFNDKEAWDDKLSILDIKARDQDGRVYNVEMQMLGLHAYPPRALYYWAVVHGSQLHEGDKYSALRATISISFVNGVVFPKVPDFHLSFQLRSSKYPDLIFSEHQDVHLVELPKFKKTAEALNDPLDEWCYFLVHGANLDTDNLPESLRNTAVPKAMEVLKMFSQSELERDRYEARIKFQRDQHAYLEEALEDVERARQDVERARQDVERARQDVERARQDVERARQEAIVNRIHFCQHLLKLPETLSEELSALPLEEIQAKAETLERQLAERFTGK